MTSQEALGRFFEALAQADATAEMAEEQQRRERAAATATWIKRSVPKRVSTAVREAQIREAKRFLDELGI